MLGTMSLWSDPSSVFLMVQFSVYFQLAFHFFFKSIWSSIDFFSLNGRRRVCGCMFRMALLQQWQAMRRRDADSFLPYYLGRCATCRGRILGKGCAERCLYPGSEGTPGEGFPIGARPHLLCPLLQAASRLGEGFEPLAARRRHSARPGVLDR